MTAQILTLEEVAALLRVSTPTVRKAISTQGLPAAKVGTQWRFRRDDVNAWIQEQTEAQEHGRRSA